MGILPTDPLTSDTGAGPGDPTSPEALGKGVASENDAVDVTETDPICASDLEDCTDLSKGEEDSLGPQLAIPIDIKAAVKQGIK